MSDSSDESSDSSKEFLIDPDKINLNSSFFTTPVKHNLKVPETDSEEESDENYDLDNVNENNSAEIFSQVLKNLESTEIKVCNDENYVKHQTQEKAKVRVETQNHILSNEINELLLQGETGAISFDKNSESLVDEDAEATRDQDYTIPKEGVKITLPGTELMLHKRKKGKRNIETLLKNRIRAHQVLIEKVGRLCWLAYGFYLNRQINEPIVMSTTLSLVPTNNYPKGRTDLTYLEKFTKWFKNTFTIELSINEVGINKKILLNRLKEKKIYNYKELVLLYIATLRAIGINCRLIMSLCPPRPKLIKEMSSKVEEEKPENKKNAKVKNSKQREVKQKINSGMEKGKESVSETEPKNSQNATRNARLEARKKAAEILKAQSSSDNKKKVANAKNSKEPKDIKITGHKEETKSANIFSPKHLRSRKLLNSTSTDCTKTDVINCSNAKEALSKNLRVEKKKLSRAATSKESDVDSGEEFVPKTSNKRKVTINKTQLKVNSKENKKNKEVLSSESEKDKINVNDKLKKDIWVEVYVESEESWICVNIMDEKVHCEHDVYKKATHPVLYVVAWNSENLIKDVTRRYCPNWLTVTRKQRIDEKWWKETLTYWQEKETAISKAEDEMLLQRELEQPLPKTIAECKGHPLYVLIRHLLKYEALYPPNCVPLGHLKTGEAIYSRHCVHTLCSRETWLKKARVVKPNQEPYKIVKALPKYDKLSGMKLKDTALEIFGEWQTTEYVPPEAKDGIVPRNEYGNVDLFKQCMLPKGTVHINLPGLNRVARKLNIDCAPAVVGFNFGCMGAVPAFEGFVVCSEYEDTLREAWEAEQVEASKRAKERYEKRVYGNWKKLIRGLLIREKLAAKYEFQNGEEEDQSNKRSKQKKTDRKKAKIL